MTNAEGMTKPERVLSLNIRASFVIRHSDFVIPLLNVCPYRLSHLLHVDFWVAILRSALKSANMGNRFFLE